MVYQTREAQQELDGMPEPTPLEQKALRYIELKETAKGIEHDLKIAKEELVQEFLKSQKNSIRINMRTLIYTHRDTDSIQIRAAKNE